MRLTKAAITSLILSGIVFLSMSCSQSSTATPAKTQITTAQKGNISIVVTGTGNLTLENKQSLSFGQTGVAQNVQTSKISEVDVKAGQTVDKDAVLVKADPKDWQDQITSLQHQLDSANASLAQSQTALLQAQNALISDQYKLSMQQDVANIQTKIDNSNAQLQAAQNMLIAASAQSGLDTNYWRQVVANSNTDIANYKKQMSDLLKDPAHYMAASSVNSTTASVAQISSMQNTIQQDQANIQQAQTNITLKQNALADAQSALDDEKAAAQVITAPFQGLITKVNVNQGDIVKRDASLIEIAEPEKFQAIILVTERDVFNVKMDGDAAVSFDALQGLNFPAKIIQIAPLATVQQGVVNYQVTVELTSLRPITAGQNRTGQRPAASSTGGTASSTNSPRPSGTPSASAGPRPSSVSATGQAFIPQTVALKDGLSATVNIPVQQKDNILIVPNRAIGRQGQNSVVQVIKGTTTEARIVKIGISDGINTEITDGLTEGEQISIQSATSATSTPRPGGVPGMGGFRIGG